ncbi:MaoC/PaaZ C-terminal domain-containing protein [Croceicoccus sp. BE223]|uniref:MaoC/PaaZ C-terminal domain-containing protein n=1 Tax=Croceicoccus sp. BE223 TaxID=2817716 RepID=UPI00285D4762|nr:MaoC/PaaZ C-terminal domain-containing protein [Croceicoccus sp. BE223]MDR7102725.1 acyl dehydratase [Croceicoccus sp. BE223]
MAQGGETAEPAGWQSDWVRVSQDMIDQFADLTEDWNAIHVDADAARAAGFAGPVAHGFLLLSLLAPMFYDCGHPLAAGDGGINYGFDSLRFVAPVVAGTRVRARFAEAGREARSGGLRVVIDVTMEREGEERPALAGQWTMLLPG